MKKTIITLSIILAVIIAGSFVFAISNSENDSASPDLRPNAAIVNPPFYLNAQTVNTTGVSLELKNNGDDTYTVSRVSVTNCGETPTAPGSVASGGSVLAHVNCTLSAGTTFKGTITVYYTKTGSSLTQTTTGSITQRVVDASENDSLTPGCRSLYWFDNANKSCGQKQFCGAYMYLGLQTFDSKTQCENALNNSSNNSANNSSCKNLYWFDNDNKSCGQKEFCGAYMYLGLQTFDSKTQCENALEINKTKECPSNSGDENGKCMFNLSNGRKAEIKIMPETASQNAIDRLGELNFTVQLKEVGKGLNVKPVYELTGNKQGKFLGIFKIMARVQAQVDAGTGDTKVIKPWWSFLASGV